ncbi:MAG: adenylate/guanylate cyclase domain-containing protein, partial [Acetobacterales bacterium]
TMDGPTWGEPGRPPGTSQTFVVLRTPLRSAGALAGVLTHVVPIVELSRFISLRAGRYMTSFVLYGGDRVLAHPALIHRLPRERGAVLPRLDEVGDPVLAAIWDGAAMPLNMVARSERSRIVGREIGGERHLIAYRTLDGYGPLSWIVGSHATFDVVDAQVSRVRYTLLTGAGLMLLAAAAGIAVARALSRPVQRQAELAHLVYAKRLDDIAPLPRSRFIEFDDSAAAFNRMVRGMRDRRRARGLLGRYVPEAVAEALLGSEGGLEPQSAVATVLFVDLADFTAMTERLGPACTVEVLNAWFSAVVEIVERRRGVVTQFQGDAILATFNVPAADPGHAAQAVAAAREILGLVDSRVFAGERIACRIGINTGPVVAGTVGAAGRLNYTVHGDAVNVAARLEGLNRTYGTRLLVAAETARQSGDADLCRVGEIAVRGHSGPVEVFSIRGEAGGCG